jgi:hypothetical protein
VCVDVKFYDVYHWQRSEREEKCTEWGLSAEGLVQELREGLTVHVRSCWIGEMGTTAEVLGRFSNETGAVFCELSGFER